jgi:CheY-like chemotaxis protein
MNNPAKDRFFSLRFNHQPVPSNAQRVTSNAQRGEVTLEETMNSETRILIVDDEKGIREVLLSLFSVRGYAPVAVSNGREALETFGRSPFDLVITDLDMPQVDGLHLASSIKERSPNTPVLMITARGKEEVKDSNVDALMSKPFSLAELEEAVHRLVPRSIQEPVYRLPLAQSPLTA